MASNNSQKVTVTVKDNTTIILDGVEYSGVVEVDTDTAEKLKETGGLEDGEAINA